MLFENQSNDIENYPVLFLICPIRFSILVASSRRSFLLIWQIFSRKPLSKICTNECKPLEFVNVFRPVRRMESSSVVEPGEGVRG